MKPCRKILGEKKVLDYCIRFLFLDVWKITINNNVITMLTALLIKTNKSSDSLSSRLILDH